jgi:hypothetical protein
MVGKTIEISTKRFVKLSTNTFGIVFASLNFKSSAAPGGSGKWPGNSAGRPPFDPNVPSGSWGNQQPSVDNPGGPGMLGPGGPSGGPSWPSQGPSVMFPTMSPVGPSGDQSGPGGSGGGPGGPPSASSTNFCQSQNFNVGFFSLLFYKIKMFLVILGRNLLLQFAANDFL